jgi:hypothetical protein
MTDETKDSSQMELSEIRLVFKSAGYRFDQFAADYGASRTAVTLFFQGKSVSTPMYRSAQTMARYFLARAKGKRK